MAEMMTGRWHLWIACINEFEWVLRTEMRISLKHFKFMNLWLTLRIKLRCNEGQSKKYKPENKTETSLIKKEKKRNISGTKSGYLDTDPPSDLMTLKKYYQVKDREKKTNN